MDEVTVEIEAPPERVWALVADVTNMGRWSPETYACKWVDGAHAPALGAKFKGSNKRGLMRWSTVSTITTLDEPSHIAWEVDNSGMRWGYRFEPSGTGTGTKLTEYREEVRGKPLYVRVAYKLGLMGRDPDGTITRGMRETVERLKAAAETS